LLTGMSWSCIGDTQGVDMQCEAYICPWIASYPVIMVCSTGFSPAFYPITIFLHGATAPWVSASVLSVIYVCVGMFM
jgi:hypothetical protein